MKLLEWWRRLLCRLFDHKATRRNWFDLSICTRCGDFVIDPGCDLTAQQIKIRLQTWIGDREVRFVKPYTYRLATTHAGDEEQGIVRFDVEGG